MKSIKSAITTIALVATAFSCGVADAESITVKMESVREDSVEHLFQPMSDARLPDRPAVGGRTARDPIGCWARDP